MKSEVSGRRSWGFLWHPRWVFGHVLALALLAAFIGAGSWQLNRHFERADRNEALALRSAAPTLSAADLWPANSFAGAAANSAPILADALARLEWRTVEMSGRWAHADAVLIRNRSHEGLAGCWLAAPLELAAAADVESDTPIPLGVLVMAGWVPNQTCTNGVAASGASADGEVAEKGGFGGDERDRAASDEEVAVGLARSLLPSGEVSVAGRVRLTQTRSLFGAADPSSGRLGSLARVDVRRIDAQTPQSLAPPYVELTRGTGLGGAGLAIIAAPETNAGPHLGYSFQYLAFALVALIGYPLVLARQASQHHPTNYSTHHTTPNAPDAPDLANDL